MRDSEIEPHTAKGGISATRSLPEWPQQRQISGRHIRAEESGRFQLGRDPANAPSVSSIGQPEWRSARGRVSVYARTRPQADEQVFRRSEADYDYPTGTNAVAVSGALTSL